MRIVLRNSLIIFIVIVMLLALAILFAPSLGWQIDAVMSGSMSPTLEEGCIVVSRPTAPEDIELGDIITYHSPQDGEMTTHRVVGIEESCPLCFQTMGDNNKNIPDDYIVPASNIKGKTSFSVPLLGYVTNFLKTPFGFFLIIGLPGLVIITLQIKRIWAGLSEEDEKETIQVNDYIQSVD